MLGANVLTLAGSIRHQLLNVLVLALANQSQFGEPVVISSIRLKLMWLFLDVHGCNPYKVDVLHEMVLLS